MSSEKLDLFTQKHSTTQAQLPLTISFIEDNMHIKQMKKKEKIKHKLISHYIFWHLLFIS